jgi:hypothetical protein
MGLIRNRKLTRPVLTNGLLPYVDSNDFSFVFILVTLFMSLIMIDNGGTSLKR